MMRVSRAVPTHRASGFFLLRTPLRPITDLLDWGGLDVRSASAPAGALGDAISSDVRALRERFRMVVERPSFRDAIFTASPSLAETQPYWDKAPDSERGKKFEHAAIRYFARMSGRCTPFGLFAGCSLGSVGDGGTRLELAPASSYRRFSRFDVDYLETLVQTLRGRVAEPSRKLRVNSSLYTTDTDHRYVEVRVKDSARVHHFVRVTRTPYLDEVLARARHGATAAALAEALVASDPEIQQAEALDFIAELEHSQLLTSELELLVTGGDAARELHRVLRALPGQQSLAELLGGAIADLEDVDRRELGSGGEVLRRLEQRLEKAPVPLRRNNLLHVELHKPGNLRLSSEVTQRILADVSALSRLARSASRGGLKEFREAFEKRFETRLVPLALALDEESGVGFGKADADQAEMKGAAVLAGLRFGGAKSRAREAEDFPSALLLAKLQEIYSSGLTELTLSDSDLDQFGHNPQELPDAFALSGSLLAASPEALDRGEFKFFLDNFLPNSGCSILGRFASGNDELRQQMVEHIRAEESLRPDVVFAEIVHQPDGRVGNIIARPVLRQYEIPYLGRSGAGEAAEIPLDDLWVTVRDGERVVLWSKQLNREVVPRLATAHNTPLSTLGIYRFLAALQYQDMLSIRWSWGPLDTAPFLPRVTYRNIILAWARWRVDGQELRRWCEAPSLAEQFAAVQAYRARARLPRWVCLVESDNVLPVDLDNVLSVESMLQVVGRQQVVLLEEYGLLESAPCTQGPEGPFVHELVLPFVRQEPRKTKRFSLGGDRGHERERSFAPGSEWTYLKLYSGAHTRDALVSDLITAFSRKAAEASVRWFFIRYADPQHHLRLRFATKDTRLRAALTDEVHALTRRFFGDYGVYRVEHDTYERETERYGGPDGVELAEALFHHDSVAVASSVQLLRSSEVAERWPYVLWGMHQVLEASGLDLDARVRLLTDMRADYTRRLRLEAAFEHALGKRFRTYRPRLEKLLAGQVAALQEGPAHEGIWKTYGAASRPLFGELRTRGAAGSLNRPFASLLPSFLHMHANRMLPAAANQYEVVIYDFLLRLYDSARARAKKGGG
ncbi:lantibiotic dehydratase [Archangium lansingense]|uniref:Lantibiotic dehydratase n=1 Tax=Archangium lansingense TaxID=2995310 RepID=A0ABT4A811_9BACT|nr:lantibiotic dehydratase [Archangium lansinium]MCY1077795.1 lantibiotic dehydratase [Archangium lansinium]